MILTPELRDELRPILVEAMDAALEHAPESAAMRLAFECRLDEVTALDATPDGAELPESVEDAARYWCVIA